MDRRGIQEAAPASPSPDGGGLVSYRQFRLAYSDLRSATVATSATVRPEAPESVATVASVAAPGAANTILSAYRRMFEACAYGSPPGRCGSSSDFSIIIGLTPKPLAGATLNFSDAIRMSAFATVRYDCMGAVTIAALTATPIATVSQTEIRSENGLASRRPFSSPVAKPVWVVFPDRPWATPDDPGPPHVAIRGRDKCRRRLRHRGGDAARRVSCV